MTELMLRGQEQPQGRMLQAPELILPKRPALAMRRTLEFTDDCLDFQSSGNACDYLDCLVVLQGEDLWPSFICAVIAMCMH